MVARQGPDRDENMQPRIPRVLVPLVMQKANIEDVTRFHCPRTI